MKHTINTLKANKITIELKNGNHKRKIKVKIAWTKGDILCPRVMKIKSRFLCIEQRLTGSLILFNISIFPRGI